MADTIQPPREGDEYVLRDGRVVLVDGVSNGMVAYRLTDGNGGLLAALRANADTLAVALLIAGGRRG